MIFCQTATQFRGMILLEVFIILFVIFFNFIFLSLICCRYPSCGIAGLISHTFCVYMLNDFNWSEYVNSAGLAEKGTQWAVQS